jgi:predicted O-methyltransferase YrrM
MDHEVMDHEGMDRRVSEVLDLYHRRMQDEAGLMRQAASQPDDSWLDRVLLAVGPDTGRLINILVRSLKSPNILELGTSYGYSGIWLADAARATGGRVTTMELQDYKSKHAHAMAEKAGLADHIDFKVGDAVQMIDELRALPGGVLSQAQPGCDRHRRQHDLSRLGRGAALRQGDPRQARHVERAASRRLRP